MENIDFKKILKRFLKSFVCLRYGECCRRYGIWGVPGYNKNGEWAGDLSEKGMKPEGYQCRHLIPAAISPDGKWKMATCKIHGQPDYSNECAIFCLGSGYCILGVFLWKRRKNSNPGLELPDIVKRALKIIKSIKNLETRE